MSLTNPHDLGVPSVGTAMAGTSDRYLKTQKPPYSLSDVQPVYQTPQERKRKRKKTDDGRQRSHRPERRGLYMKVQDQREARNGRSERCAWRRSGSIEWRVDKQEVSVVVFVKA